MKTVKEVSNLTGISVRTLHHYDEIGLLKPTEVTEAGYRLYDDTALERLQMVLLFRELQFPLKAKTAKFTSASGQMARKSRLQKASGFLSFPAERGSSACIFLRAAG